jgi:hypothetical protein
VALQHKYCKKLQNGFCNGEDMKILQWITSLFHTQSYQDNIERYVASKQPKSVSDIEYWVKNHQYQQGRRSI